MIGLSLLVIAIAYLVGSIPTGYWLCMYYFNVDVTRYGSGNIGATNVARVLGGGIKYFLVVLALDACKAFVMLALADAFAKKFVFMGRQEFLIASAVALLLGNACSVFLRFKGGKGVATTFGVIFYLVPFSLILLFILVWSTVLASTRQMFMASLSAAAALLLGYGLLYSSQDMIFYFFMFIFVWLVVRHQNNIVLFMRSRLR